MRGADRQAALANLHQHTECHLRDSPNIDEARCVWYPIATDRDAHKQTLRQGDVDRDNLPLRHPHYLQQRYEAPTTHLANGEGQIGGLRSALELDAPHHHVRMQFVAARSHRGFGGGRPGRRSRQATFRSLSKPARNTAKKLPSDHTAARLLTMVRSSNFASLLPRTMTDAIPIES